MPAPSAPPPPPPILTGLAPDPRQPDHRLVDVNRGRVASLPSELLTGLKLQLGEALSPTTLARLYELAREAKAERAALRALARRDYARFDLRRRLLKQRHPEPAVEATLVRLASRGLVDDRRFAIRYAALHAPRGRGPARLVNDLLRQGVDRRTAEEAVGCALADEGVDLAREARALALKRSRQLGELPKLVRRRRLLAFLLRRGYARSDIGPIVDELCR